MNHQVTDSDIQEEEDIEINSAVSKQNSENLSLESHPFGSKQLSKIIALSDKQNTTSNKEAETALRLFLEILFTEKKKEKQLFKALKHYTDETVASVLIELSGYFKDHKIKIKALSDIDDALLKIEQQAMRKARAKQFSCELMDFQETD